MLRELRKLCRRLDKEYDINSGGCCYLAYLIASNLPCKLVVYSIEEKIRSAIIEEIANFKNVNFSVKSITDYNVCTHYAVEYEGKIINGMRNTDFHRYIIPASVESIAFIYKTGKWNDVYDTRNNPKIKQIINNFFNEHKKRMG